MCTLWTAIEKHVPPPTHPPTHPPPTPPPTPAFVCVCARERQTDRQTDKYSETERQRWSLPLKRSHHHRSTNSPTIMRYVCVSIPPPHRPPRIKRGTWGLKRAQRSSCLRLPYTRKRDRHRRVCTGGESEELGEEKKMSLTLPQKESNPGPWVYRQHGHKPTSAFSTHQYAKWLSTPEITRKKKQKKNNRPLSLVMLHSIENSVNAMRILSRSFWSLEQPCGLNFKLILLCLSES